MSYEAWLQEVDHAVREITALELALFDEYPLHDSYQAGISPADAAMQVITADPFGRNLLIVLGQDAP